MKSQSCYKSHCFGCLTASLHQYNLNRKWLAMKVLADRTSLIGPSLLLKLIVIVVQSNSHTETESLSLSCGAFSQHLNLLSIPLPWGWIDPFPSGQYCVYCPMKLVLMKSTTVLSFCDFRDNYQCGVSSGVAGLHMTFGFLEPRFTIACCHCSLDRHQSGSQNTEDRMRGDGTALCFLFFTCLGVFFRPTWRKITTVFTSSRSEIRQWNKTLSDGLWCE